MAMRQSFFWRRKRSEADGKSPPTPLERIIGISTLMYSKQFCNRHLRTARRKDNGKRGFRACFELFTAKFRYLLRHFSTAFLFSFPISPTRLVEFRQESHVCVFDGKKRLRSVLEFYLPATNNDSLGSCRR